MDLNDMKIGTIILWEKQPVMIIWSNRMRTAQRKPVMQTKMRNVITGKVYEYSFKFGESIEEADVERENSRLGAVVRDRRNLVGQALLVAQLEEEPPALSGEA